jgi:predicted molibdopterin-dependent oxidoreductase YjgC
MFRRLTESAERRLTVFVDGAATAARDGDSVAAVLLAAGHASCCTTAASGRRRGPYCLMGVCFDCLLVIDGVANRQACMTSVRDGMRIETQRGKRELGA